MMGGARQQDHNDPEHFDRALLAIKSKLNVENNGIYHLVPLKVLKAETQVVAGIKYIYEVVVGESSVKKSDLGTDDLTKEHCTYRGEGPRAVYKVSIWEQPWKDFREYNFEKLRDVAADETF